MDKLIEYQLQDFTWRETSDRELLRFLYHELLRHDNHWHYMWEGSWTIIRVHHTNEAALDAWLEQHGMKHTKVGEWKDNIEITAKYQYLFQPMFHAFSVLTLTMEEPDLFQVLDRVCHIFLNNARSTGACDRKDYREWMGQFHDQVWEAMMLNKVASERALTVGWLQGRSYGQEEVRKEAQA